MQIRNQNPTDPMPIEFVDQNGTVRTVCLRQAVFSRVDETTIAAFPTDNPKSFFRINGMTERQFRAHIQTRYPEVNTFSIEGDSRKQIFLSFSQSAAGRAAKIVGAYI